MAEKDTTVSKHTFVLCWDNFLIGFLLGIFGVLGTILFARTYRKDRIYSVVLGSVIGSVISFMLFRYMNK